MISKDMSITEIVENYPETVETLESYGMHCFGWMASRFENLEQAALAHGLDIDKLVDELNKVIKK